MKHLQISAKYHQNDAKLSKKETFFRLSNTCFAFKKNGQNRRFNLSKCAASGCARNGLGWILRVFMQFYEGLDTFEPFLITFDPF